jgi:glycosyltransferase involved in cell wall biosynthesis
MTRALSYVLITAARNEEGFIEKTIDSVRSQTRLPYRWIIVDDGSTDRTRGIVSRNLNSCPWLRLVTRPPHAGRTFAEKAKAFNMGYLEVRDLPFDIIGNLDADITFEQDYFEFLLAKFECDPRLGVAGTPFVEGTKVYDYRFVNIEHVSGACQLFRKKCFEEIGGYRPIEQGGIDWMAVTSARMNGWRTRTFEEKRCFHHRALGTGGGRRLSALFRYGEKDYLFGSHPLWEIFRSLFQMTKPPYIVGGTLIYAGYSWSYLRKAQRPFEPQLVSFYRREQLQRLKQIFSKIMSSARE